MLSFTFCNRAFELCVYSLVLPLGEHDIRRIDDKQELKLEIGVTEVEGGKKTRMWQSS